MASTAEPATATSPIVIKAWPTLYWAAGASCVLIPLAFAVREVLAQWPVPLGQALVPIAICAMPAPLLLMARVVRTEIDPDRGTIVQERWGWWGYKRETMPFSAVAEVAVEGRHTKNSYGHMPMLRLKSGDTLDLARDLAMSPKGPEAVCERVRAAMAAVSQEAVGREPTVARKVYWLALLAYLGFLTAPIWYIGLVAPHQAAQAKAKKAAEAAAATGVDALKLAANDDDRAAMLALAEAYRTGQGTPRDPRLALEWLEYASSRDVLQAHRAAGRTYALGEGVAKNRVKAHMYYSRGARWQDAQSLQALADLEAEMTPDELAQARPAPARKRR
jgi:hypothetical protein